MCFFTHLHNIRNQFHTLYWLWIVETGQEMMWKHKLDWHHPHKLKCANYWSLAPSVFLSIRLSSKIMGSVNGNTFISTFECGDPCKPLSGCNWAEWKHSNRKCLPTELGDLIRAIVCFFVLKSHRSRCQKTNENHFWSLVKLAARFLGVD